MKTLAGMRHDALKLLAAIHGNQLAGCGRIAKYLHAGLLICMATAMAMTSVGTLRSRSRFRLLARQDMPNQVGVPAKRSNFTVLGRVPIAGCDTSDGDHV